MHAARAALLALPLLCAAGPASEHVPPGFRGAWARDGRCAVAAGRLVITAKTAALGVAPPAPITFDRDDGPHGEDAVHWAQEGEVDNFVLGPAGTLIHNPEGYGMGHPELFRRCRN